MCVLPHLLRQVLHVEHLDGPRHAANRQVRPVGGEGHATTRGPDVDLRTHTQEAARASRQAGRQDRSRGAEARALQAHQGNATAWVSLGQSPPPLGLPCLGHWYSLGQPGESTPPYPALPPHTLPCPPPNPARPDAAMPPPWP